jgi:hypothetical protein
MVDTSMTSFGSKWRAFVLTWWIFVVQLVNGVFSTHQTPNVDWQKARRVRDDNEALAIS